MARYVSSTDAAEETFNDLMFMKGVPPGTNSKIRPFFAIKVVKDSIKHFLADPMLIQTDAPFLVVGGLFGDFYDLLVIFETYGYPPNRRYLFLGDIVGIGPQSSETVILLCCLKILYPTYLFILRGYHEMRSVNQKDFFYKESVERFGQEFYDVCQELFDNLSLGCLISDQILCVSSGIPHEFTTLDQFSSFTRPIDSDKTSSIKEMVSIIPDTNPNDWALSKKPTAPGIKLEQVADFTERNSIEVIIRSHELVKDGFEFPFNGDPRFLTISSKPSYIVRVEKPGQPVDIKGKEKVGVILEIEPSLKTIFRTIRPLPYEYKEYYMTKAEKRMIQKSEPPNIRQSSTGIIPSYTKKGTKAKTTKL